MTNALNVLITAGGTIAPVDDVRVLTNRSTGRFAKSLAEALLDLGANLTYIATTPQTAGPLQESARTVGALSDHLELRRNMVAQLARAWNQQSQFRRIDLSHGTVSDYAEVLRRECLGQKWDLVMLSAAVSDYEPVAHQGKKSSDEEEWTLTLKRTPKIIRQVRDWVGTGCHIAGFKLTSGATDSELTEISAQSCDVNRVDWTIGNDQSSLNQGLHRVVLVGKDRKTEWFEPGDDMPARLVRHLLKQMGT